MTATEARAGEQAPDAAEVRAALARVLASEPFRGSAQLGAFLRFIVEETLAGNAERIKGYAIAVEALGRDTSFDPAIDPIVRVEANRLRRAVDAYYAGPGRDDPVEIGLTRGSYVPTFRRRAPGAQPAAEAPRARTGGRLAGLLARPWRLALFVAVVAAAVSLGIDLAGRMIGRLAQAPRPGVGTVTTPAIEARGRLGLPVVHVESFDAEGAPDGTSLSLERLRGTLQDALSAFDEIDIVTTAPQPAQRGWRGTYRLAGTVSYAGAEVRLTVRLIEAGSGTVVWTQQFEHPRADAAPETVKDTVVQRLVMALAQPNGVIQARERQRRAAGEPMDPRYGCVLDALAYLRSYDSGEQPQVRECLQQALVNDPQFALGYAALGIVYTMEFYVDVDREPENPVLDRALRAVQRALELAPGSARAYHALMTVLFARGEHAAAIEAGEKAIDRNPWGMVIRADYGFLLLRLGEVEKGAALLRAALDAGVVQMYRLHYGLFVEAYLAGDMATARQHANAIATDTYPLGLTAKALAAAASGETLRARNTIERLVALQPSWSRDPLGELRKAFPARRIAERMAADLAALGLGATN